MIKEKQFFVERTIQFLNLRKSLKQQKSRLDDQQIDYEKELDTELDFSLNRQLPLVQKVKVYKLHVGNCRLHDMLILQLTERYVNEVAEMLEKIEPFYQKYKEKLSQEKSPLQFMDDKIKDKKVKKKPRRLMTEQEKTNREICNSPGCNNRADKNGICTECFLKGVVAEDFLK